MFQKNIDKQKNQTITRHYGPKSEKYCIHKKMFLFQFDVLVHFKCPF